MLNSFDILQWLKTLCITNVPEIKNFYCGKLDGKKLNSLGVYNLSTDTAPKIAIGGLSNTPTKEMLISLLIHYNNNYRETEEVSNKLFEKLLELEPFSINGHAINNVQLLVSNPKDISTDENGIYERVINFKLIYQK